MIRRPTRARLLGALVAVLLAMPGAGQAGAVSLASRYELVKLNLSGGLPGRWLACAGVCGEGPGEVRTVLRVSEGGGRLRWLLPDDPQGTRELQRLEYTAESREGPGGPLVMLTSVRPFRGLRLVHQYALTETGHVLSADLQVPPGARLVLEPGADLLPEPLSGLGGMYNGLRLVRVGDTGQQELAEAAGPGDWVGVRSRFWAWLVRAPEPLAVEALAGESDRPAFAIRSATGGNLRLTFYAGPVERTALKAVDPLLTGLLYAALWDWLRALCFALWFLLEGLHGLVGHWGLAIILLSLCVKVLMSPLTALADRWQADVNRIQSQLKPELDAIRRTYKGEEAHNRTLAVYRKHGVSPFFTVKSLAGFLIQIPIFIAAFDMLGENFALSGESFWWIEDLARPDAWSTLPFVLPFFGADLNLLPFLMTALTALAAWLQQDASLSAELLREQRWRLYLMAVVFFVLLYTFPAGMVLYWTANNFFHLVKVESVRIWRTRRPAVKGDTTTSDPTAAGK